MRSDRLRLHDILWRSERLIEISKSTTKEKFVENSDVFELALRHIEIIGEAVKSLPSGVRDAYPEIPWRNIARTRDIVAHVYFGINSEIIWQIVATESVELHKAVQEILAKMPPDPPSEKT